MKRTRSTIAVAVAMMNRPDEQHWGYDLSVQSGVRSGALYPILRRMHEAGWLADGWEDPQTISGRPPRRYYVLTDEGKRELGAMAAAQPRSSVVARLRPVAAR